ncbi:uncharacterized protein LOC142639681 [Castanea sativa]|uniref:uncharacterized protein LOC142639681 n=1 Tax=Castanea sativa TaxID=21020 RepID=UPI003F64D175
MKRKKEKEENAPILPKWLIHGSQLGSWGVQAKLNTSSGELAKNILHTNFCLAKRKVTEWDGCAWCGEKETSGHVLWDCKTTAKTWKESGQKLPSWKNSHRDFFDIYWKLREKAKDIDWAAFATMTWCIWNNRNLYKHEGRCKPAKVLVSEALRYTEEYKYSNSQTIQTPRQPPRVGSQWRPPEIGWYKNNVDAVVFKEDGCCGMGVVIRNEAGCLIGAMSKKLHFPLGLMEAKAQAAKEGILLARDLGLSKVIVEGDAKTIMVAFTESDPDTTPCFIQKVVEGAKFRL